LGIIRIGDCPSIVSNDRGSCSRATGQNHGLAVRAVLPSLLVEIFLVGVLTASKDEGVIGIVKGYSVHVGARGEDKQQRDQAPHSGHRASVSGRPAGLLPYTYGDIV
jgi:hypothetical protein